VVGARPQFIKLSPVIRAFRALGVPYRILHTGQHYDDSMSGVHFASLGIEEPHYNLGVGSASHARQTALMMEGIEEVLLSLRPGCVIVYGDTNSTLAGALTAAKLKIRTCHVEAGVRSFDRTMPEEINRIVADHVSHHHFCPTAHALGLLRREGIEGVLTGDVMYDAILQADPASLTQPYEPPFALATIHRAENTDAPERFGEIWEGLKLVSADIPVIFPVHPRTRKAFGGLLARCAGRMEVIDPVDYLTMLAMIRDAALVMTDSGGVQKEAFLLGTPCVTVRDVTEWPETVEAGSNVLAAADAQALLDAARTMLARTAACRVNPFGDGRAAEAIASFIKYNCMP
jgi:UDP-GlcNAc3NAcA epimerase